MDRPPSDKRETKLVVATPIETKHPYLLQMSRSNGADTPETSTISALLIVLLKSDFEMPNPLFPVNLYLMVSKLSPLFSYMGYSENAKNRTMILIYKTPKTKKLQVTSTIITFFTKVWPDKENYIYPCDIQLLAQTFYYTWSNSSCAEISSHVDAFVLAPLNPPILKQYPRNFQHLWLWCIIRVQTIQSKLTPTQIIDTDFLPITVPPNYPPVNEEQELVLEAIFFLLTKGLSIKQIYTLEDKEMRQLLVKNWGMFYLIEKNLSHISPMDTLDKKEDNQAPDSTSSPEVNTEPPPSRIDRATQYSSRFPE